MERTVGFELEVADVEKSKVFLHPGYSWSNDETIVNTYGKIVKATSLYGGELNTPPLNFNQQDRALLRSVFESIFSNRGVNIWCHGFAGHISAHDLNLDDLKSVFLLSFYSSPAIKKIADIGEWSEYPNQAPTPSYEYIQEVRRAKTLEELLNVFANSSAKGYIRHMINITSFWKHKTIEFRIFNPTYNFEELENSALFMTRFIHYALSHNEEDFKKLESEEVFRKELKFHRLLAKKLPPLIFSGDQNSERDRYISRPINLSSQMISTLIDADTDAISMVNPNLYSIELKISQNKHIKIYNQDELNHVFYLIYQEGLDLEYSDKYDFLNHYKNNTVKRHISLLLYFHKTRKLLGNSNNEMFKKEFEAQRNKIEETLILFDEWSESVISLFQKCIYIYGTIETAIENEDKYIFYQYENNSKSRATIAFLKKYSDYHENFELARVKYHNIITSLKEGQILSLVSYNEYLQMNKVALRKTFSIKNGSSKQIFYTTRKVNDEKFTYIQPKEITSFRIKEPPNDLIIDNPSLLYIEPLKPSDFFILAKTYVKHVDKISMSRYAFIVLYDGYCLGGFAFNVSKEQAYDLFLLSDFSTNNNIYRLSKLILYCIKTIKVKKTLQRSANVCIDKIYTKVYTSNHVSMKYRGVFNKVKRETPAKNLLYETNLGSVIDETSVIKMYLKLKENQKQHGE